MAFQLDSKSGCTGKTPSNLVDPFKRLSRQLFGCDIQSLKFILIELDQQRLALMDCGNELVSYTVSTAANGAGNRQNTGCTPLGWHSVWEKLGDEAPLGTVFKGRAPGVVISDLSSDHDQDAITSRILWLQGLQVGYNAVGGVDSKDRYIYIHGTAQEHLIGQPVSHGCIRMLNRDVIDLFAKIETGIPVLLSQRCDR